MGQRVLGKLLFAIERVAGPVEIERHFCYKEGGFMGLFSMTCESVERSLDVICRARMIAAVV
ncbi:MAG: hypothetical protein ACK56F_26115, partial [bacterium]